MLQTRWWVVAGLVWVAAAARAAHPAQAGLVVRESSGATRQENASLTELALRPFVPSETMASMKRILGIIALFRRSRPARRAPELVDLLLLWFYERDAPRRANEARKAGRCRREEREFVQWCWRCASSSYGFAMLKSLGLLRGFLPTSLSDVGRLDAAAVGRRCGSEMTIVSRPRKPSADTPSYWVGWCRRGAVLAIRGTADVGDATVDLVCEADEIEGGRAAHAGIAAAAAAVSAAAEEAVLEALAAAPPGTPLVVTGHSLGGGVALLLCALGGKAGISPRVRRELRRGRRSLRAVAFAPPPVLAGRISSRRARLDTYFVGHDVVPTLSMASVAAWLDRLDRVDAAVDPGTRIELLVRRALPGRNATRHDQFTSILRDALRAKGKKQRASDRRTIAEPALAIPGAVYRLDRDATRRRLPNPYVPVIRLDARSFIDHLPTSIETVIDAWTLGAVGCPSSSQPAQDNKKRPTTRPRWRRFRRGLRREGGGPRPQPRLHIPQPHATLTTKVL